MERYTGLVQQIREKSKECKALIAEKKELPVYRVKRHKTLAVRIADRCNIFYGQEKSS